MYELIEPIYNPSNYVHLSKYKFEIIYWISHQLLPNFIKLFFIIIKI